MRDDVLSSKGAQDLDTTSYQVPDLEDNKFSWKDPAMDLDSFSRPGSVTPLSPSVSDDFRMGSTAANTLVVDDEEDKEKSAPTTTATLESERPTEHPSLQRSCPFGTRLENVPAPTLFR